MSVIKEWAGLEKYSTECSSPFVKMLDVMIRRIVGGMINKLFAPREMNNGLMEG